jgi:hypothetical protein
VIHKLRRILLIVALGAGSLIGMPMDPGEIEELLHVMNQPTLEVVVEEEDDEDRYNGPCQ